MSFGLNGNVDNSYEVLSRKLQERRYYCPTWHGVHGFGFQISLDLFCDPSENWYRSLSSDQNSHVPLTVLVQLLFCSCLWTGGGGPWDWHCSDIPAQTAEQQRP